MISKVENIDCLQGVKSLSDASVDCVITSPPYWQLRDYGYTEQWGLEPTFNEYLEHLWSLMDEIYRVLKPEGTVWINLGDSYSTQSGTCSALAKGNRTWKADKTYITNRGESGNISKGGLLNKCLLLIPHRFAIGCIDRGWIVRNDIIWAKRNGMPESVTDRFSKKHEYMFFMVKSEKYYFDMDAVKDKNLGNPIRKRSSFTKMMEIHPTMSNNGIIDCSGGKNPGSVSDFWDIPTKPSSKKHYATYNETLLVKPILAGCPENGTILDPFMGTGTTGLASLRANRNFIGIEASKEYYEIADNAIKNHLSQTVIKF